MTNKEIVEMLKLLKEQAVKSCNDTAIIDVKKNSFDFVMDSAITALSQEQQSEWERDHEILKAYADGQESMKPCNDAISRQDVLNILDDMVKDYVKENDFDKAQGVAWVKVQKLPSVSTKKTGHWVKSKDGYMRCDYCGSRGSAIKARFCHHCGAKMEVEE